MRSVSDGRWVGVVTVVEGALLQGRLDGVGIFRYTGSGKLSVRHRHFSNPNPKLA